MMGQSIKYIYTFFFLVLACYAFGQSMSEQDIIEKALQDYPAMTISQLEIKKQKSLERTSFNPSQPLFSIETPSDIGLAFEIEQEIDFPTVYFNRSKWMKSLTYLVTEEAVLTKNELIRDIRSAYLNAQLAQARTIFYRSQDSLWRDIAMQSQRLFEGGEINKADQLFAESQSELLHIKLVTAQTDAENALFLLSNYANEEVRAVDDFIPAIAYEPNGLDGFYFDRLVVATSRAGQAEIDMWKAHRLPGFIFGYVRSPERDTDFRYRYKIGMTIPIWQGQYTGEIESARASLAITEAEAELKRRQASTARLQWQKIMDQSAESIDWFEINGIPRMNSLVDTYMRLYVGGEIDYTIALRNIVEALQLQDQYLETLALYQNAIIQLEFLSGQ